MASLIRCKVAIHSPVVYNKERWSIVSIIRPIKWENVCIVINDYYVSQGSIVRVAPDILTQIKSPNDYDLHDEIIH